MWHMVRKLFCNFVMFAFQENKKQTFAIVNCSSKHIFLIFLDCFTLLRCAVHRLMKNLMTYLRYAKNVAKYLVLA